MKHGDEWGDPGKCENGDTCQYCHTRTEQQFHPEVRLGAGRPFRGWVALHGLFGKLGRAHADSILEEGLRATGSRPSVPKGSLPFNLATSLVLSSHSPGSPLLPICFPQA